MYLDRRISWWAQAPCASGCDRGIVLRAGCALVTLPIGGTGTRRVGVRLGRTSGLVPFGTQRSGLVRRLGRSGVCVSFVGCVVS